LIKFKFRAIFHAQIFNQELHVTSLSTWNTKTAKNKLNFIEILN
jgi:hypothetical protein